jgi:integrase
MKPPGLHLHKTGQWFVMWGRKFRYLGRDRKVAEDRYLHDEREGLPAWTRWREQRSQAARSRPHSVSITVLELAAKFTAAIRVETGEERANGLDKHLRRFVASFGLDTAANVRPIQIQSLKDQMIRDSFAPRTINHDLQAVRQMFRWAVRLEYIHPVNLDGVRKERLGEIPDRSLPVTAVQRFICQAPGQLRAWLAITYLCGMRPSETVRVVRNQGHWVHRGVFKLDKYKTHRISPVARHILFTPEALRWLALCEPVWTRLDSFSPAVHRYQTDPDGDPLHDPAWTAHRLRHSAATHLLARRVPRADVDEWLGHYPGRVSVTYMPMRWLPLRRLGRRIDVGMRPSLD